MFYPQKVYLQQERQALLGGRGSGRETTPHSAQREAMSEVQHRLVFIPITFILLRMWGTIQFFLSLALTHTIKRNPPCLSESELKVFHALRIAQVNCME